MPRILSVLQHETRVCVSYCRYLAHMYMGEALVALDKIADGIQHLNPELVTDIATTLPEQKLEQGNDKWTPMYSLFAICIDKTTLDWECLFPHGVKPSLKGATFTGKNLLPCVSKFFPLIVAPFENFE